MSHTSTKPTKDGHAMLDVLAPSTRNLMRLALRLVPGDTKLAAGIFVEAISQDGGWQVTSLVEVAIKSLCCHDAKVGNLEHADEEGALYDGMAASALIQAANNIEQVKC